MPSWGSHQKRTKMLGIASSFSGKKRSTDSTLLLYRRDKRSRSVNMIRGFTPNEAMKFLAVNPFQPPQADACDSDVLLLVSTDNSDVAADSFVPPELRSQYLVSIPPQYTRSRSRMRSCMDDPAAASMSSSTHPTPENGSLLPPQSPDTGSAPPCALSSPLPSPIVPINAIDNNNEALILMLHQEALYRQLFFPEVDHWFTSMVEAAWDERDCLLLAAEEDVQRYWVSSDEWKARETLMVFKRDAEVGHERVISKKHVAMNELVTRSELLQGYHQAIHEIESDMLESFHTARLRERERIRAEEAEEIARSGDGADLPEISKPLRPGPPSSNLLSHSPSPPPQRQRRPDFESRRMDEELHTFLFGNPHVLAFIPDSEMLTRTHIVSAEERARHYMRALYEHYVSSTATLRRPSHSRALTLEEAELAERRVLHGHVFDVLQDACLALAILGKREMERSVEPLERKVIMGLEREDWLHARRAECSRNHSESLAEEEALKQHRIEQLRVEQELSRQRMLFERAECDARFEVTRRETRMRQLIHDESLEDRAVAMAFQMRYELRSQTVLWTPQTYEAVFLNEVSSRGRLVKQEENERVNIRSREVTSYLHSHRNMMINRDVAAMMMTE